VSLISWIIVGLIAGWLAEKFIRGGRFGLIGDMFVGVIGGLLGGFVASTFLNIGSPLSGITLGAILVAFAGSVILLILLRYWGGGHTNIFR
jgi:uncharacterized membrane protein YeaQ/YmgE (transglycosylase-associated protein family)